MAAHSPLSPSLPPSLSPSLSNDPPLTGGPIFRLFLLSRSLFGPDLKESLRAAAAPCESLALLVSELLIQIHRTPPIISISSSSSSFSSSAVP